MARKKHPIVLRFEGMDPSDIGGYAAHCYRSGGDLGHIFRNKSEPRRLLGTETWAQEALAEIELMKVETFAAELEDLDRRNRRKDLAKRRIEGPRDPWRASRHGPMRELILTANKEWFEQTESSDVEFSTAREEQFQERAVAWLEEYFGDDVIHARADTDEQAYHARRPKHLFSGLLTCGHCGGGFTMVVKTYFGCANARYKGTCDNFMTITRSDLEARVLTGLKDQLLHPDLIAEFARAYQEEFNRLAGTVKKDHAKAERDLATVSGQIDRFIDAITNGMFHESMKSKMDALEARKAALEAEMRSMPQEEPVLLHPSLSDVYRGKVANLAEALNDPAAKTEATEIIRSLLSEIRLTPEGDKLCIVLVGELAGLLLLGSNKNARSVSAAGGSVSLVAGA